MLMAEPANVSQSKGKKKNVDFIVSSAQQSIDWRKSFITNFSIDCNKDNNNLIISIKKKG